MTAGPPNPDLERDDVDVLPSEVRVEIEAFAARHRAGPPLAVLRAASAEALPSPWQEEAATALASSPWQQQVVAGAHDAEADADLMPSESAALLARIHREAAQAAGARSPLRGVIRFGLPLLAAAALVLAVVMVRPGPPPPASTSDAAPAAATPAAPAYRIAVEAAPVKLTAAALARRSPGQGGVFTDDAAPAFSAYRSGRFADAAAAFADLARRYPNAPEAAFYLGVSRLLSGDPAGARTALMAARRIDDPIFRDDVAWYLAASEERSGEASAAQGELRALCQGHSAFAARACDAASRFPAK